MVNESRPYRLNVGIVVFNRRGRVLVGERINYPGVFQFPQGGLDPGEDPQTAARRELYEEVGLEPGDPPVGEVPDWLTYEFPPDVPEHLKKYRGQKQKWFFFYWDGDPGSLSLDHHEMEFSRVKWADFHEIVEGIVEFKRPVYREVEATGKRIIEDYLHSI